MLAFVERYTATNPGNVLAGYLPALRSVNGSDLGRGAPRLSGLKKRRACGPACGWLPVFRLCGARCRPRYLGRSPAVFGGPASKIP